MCNILHSQSKLLSTVHFQCDTCLPWYTLSFALLQFLTMSYSMLVGLTVKSGQTPSNFNYALHVLIGLPVRPEPESFLLATNQQ